VDRDLSRSRAVLIGNSTYRTDSGIPNLPAATLCVAAMTRLLTSDLCGWPADRIQPLVDVPAPHELARQITRAVQDVQGTVLLYYVGHGMRTPKGQLALALGDSDGDPSLLSHTAILYENVADILRGCPASTKLVILDCCHAELGNKANYVFQSASFAEAYPVDGLYFIGASKTHEKAKTPTGGELTYFTGSLLDTIEEGIPNRPEFLSMGQIFAALRSRMLGHGLPEPVDSGIRDARQFLFARNAAPAETFVDYEAEYNRLRQEPAHAGQAQHLRILNNALRTATQIREPGARAVALADIATVLAATDPVRARQAGVDAERAAQSITDRNVTTQSLAEAGKAVLTYYGLGWRGWARTVSIPQVFTSYFLRGWVLGVVAEAVALTDPDHAEGIAQALTTESSKVAALVRLIAVAGATDPDRAVRLSADAEQITQSVADKNPRASSLTQFARTAAGDPDRTARVTYHATWKAQALADIAVALAAADPDNAARLGTAAGSVAESITDKHSKVSALTAVTVALTTAAVALADADRAAELCVEAERVAQSITDPSARARALAVIAEIAAASEPGRAVRLCKEAERVAGSVIVKRLSPTWVTVPKVQALTAIVTALIAVAAVVDADHSTEISEDAERVAASITKKSSRVRALALVAEAAAVLDRDRAIRIIGDAVDIAASITKRNSRVRALAAVAEAAALFDPDRATQISEDAEHVAQSIPDAKSASEALAAIASAAAASDPDRAEAIAQAIADDSLKVLVLVRVAKALATTTQPP
jgi:hypothetical protein